MKIFVLDNYDSFTFNLVQYFGELGADVAVVRNDHVTIDDVAPRKPDAVVISPGPGTPSDAGVSVALVGWCADTSTPLLGVCLGHQAIGEAFGARIIAAPAIMHGKTSVIHHDGAGVLAGLSNPFEATRYHSLVIERASMPDVLQVTAWTPGPAGVSPAGDIVMAVQHADLPIYGVQFHPESVLTAQGMDLLRNFLSATRSIRR